MSLAKIHVAKKQLGLDEDTYRAVLRRVTGKDSSKGMTNGEMSAVVTEMTRLGFQPGPAGTGKSGRRALEGTYAKKLQALWISGWHLGVVRDRRAEALCDWIQGQTGIARPEWLRDPKKGSAAVDALKAWIARESGVTWTPGPREPAWAAAYGYRVARAQYAILEPGASGPAFWIAVASVLERAVVSRKPTDSEWHKVTAAWGERVRALKKATAS